MSILVEGLPIDVPQIPEHKICPEFFRKSGFRAIPAGAHFDRHCEEQRYCLKTTT